MAHYARYELDETGELQKVVYNCGVGFCLPFYGTEAPPGTLACDGSEISREAYKELFAVLGTKAGAGDGATTFNLPDFRGDFIRCVGGNAAALGVKQGDAIRDITGQLWGRYITNSGGVSEDHRLLNAQTRPNAFETTNGTLESTGESIQTDSPPTGGQQIYFKASNVVPTATENRPVNVALLWCIIYE